MNAELLKRHDKVLSSMDSNGFSAMVLGTGDNIQYFTGVNEHSVHTCSVLILSRKAKPILVALWLDREAVEKQSQDIEIETYTDKNMREVIPRILNRLGITKDQVGIDRRALQIFGDSIRKSLPDAKLLDATEAIVMIRLVKSPQEIKLIKEACRIATGGMQAVENSLREGVTELQVSVAIETRMIELGSDMLKHHMMVASGSRSKLIHPFASQKKVANGDLVTIDTGAVYQGYCSDIARTFSIGKPSEEVKSAYSVLCEAQNVVLSKLIPGASIKEIVTSAHKVAKRYGYQVIGHVGHSTGLSVEEIPRLENSPRTDPDLKLDKDMTFAFFQGSLQRGGSTGIRLEDTVLIGESGPQILTDYPREIRDF